VPSKLYREQAGRLYDCRFCLGEEKRFLIATRQEALGSWRGSDRSEFSRKAFLIFDPKDGVVSKDLPKEAFLLVVTDHD
jgi:hypothetical protein